MSRSECLNGRQNEVNDERQESGNQGMVKPVPEDQQEGEGRILDELVALTGYNRWYVAGLLRKPGQPLRYNQPRRLIGVDDEQTRGCIIEQGNRDADG